MSGKYYSGMRHFLWLITIASAHPIGAQVPATTSRQPVVAAIPNTPAGAALHAWLDAFNNADTALLGAYKARYEPEITVSDELSFREQTGGFELLSIERSEPRHLEFTVRERNSPMTALGVLEVSSAEPQRVKTRRLQAMGPNVSPAGLVSRERDRAQEGRPPSRPGRARARVRSARRPRARDSRRPGWSRSCE